MVIKDFSDYGEVFPGLILRERCLIVSAINHIGFLRLHFIKSKFKDNDGHQNRKDHYQPGDGCDHTKLVNAFFNLTQRTPGHDIAPMRITLTSHNRRHAYSRLWLPGNTVFTYLIHILKDTWW
jgi:hypothetical protein